jgi:hypothetical protein
MAINHQIVALNSSAATAVSIPQSNQIPYETKVSYAVTNLDPTIIIYLGSSLVTSSSYGYPLLGNQTFFVDLLPGDNLYAIAASGTPNVAVFVAEV